MIGSLLLTLLKLCTNAQIQKELFPVGFLNLNQYIGMYMYYVGQFRQYIYIGNIRSLRFCCAWSIRKPVLKNFLILIVKSLFGKKGNIYIQFLICELV